MIMYGAYITLMSLGSWLKCRLSLVTPWCLCVILARLGSIIFKNMFVILELNRAHKHTLTCLPTWIILYLCTCMYMYMYMYVPCTYTILVCANVYCVLKWYMYVHTVCLCQCCLLCMCCCCLVYDSHLSLSFSLSLSLSLSPPSPFHPSQSDNDELNKTLPPNFRFHHHHSSHSHLSPSPAPPGSTAGTLMSSPVRISPIRSSEMSSHQRSRTSTSSLQRRQPVARNQRPPLSLYARNKEKRYMGKSDPAIARNVSCHGIGLPGKYKPISVECWLVIGGLM